jgi:hypothetical protein
MIKYGIVAAMVMFVFAGDADACGRCRRRSCGGCNYKYVAPVQYAPASYSTNFVFNNLVPSPFLLAQGGSSVYGVQASSLAYSESPSFYMDRAARFTDRAFDLATTGQALYSQGAVQAMQLTDDYDRRHTNAQIAMLAMDANRGTTNQQLSVQIGNGPPQIQRQQAPPGPVRLGLAQSCSSCHDGRGTQGAPKHIVLDGSVPIDRDIMRASSAAIISGKMPPNSSLTPLQKTEIIDDLHSFIARAPVIRQQEQDPNVPPPVPQEPEPLPTPPQAPAQAPVPPAPVPPYRDNRIN